MACRMGPATIRASIVVLATVLMLTLAVTTPALAQNRPPIPFGQDHIIFAINDWNKGIITLQNRPPIQRPDQVVFVINDKGGIDMGGDVVLGKCSDLLQHRNEVRDLEKLGALRACKKAGFTANGSRIQDSVEPKTPLTKTGGPPLILVPIALLVGGGLLIRKSAAL